MTQTDSLPGRLQALSGSGMSTRQIGRQLHMSQSAVSRQLRAIAARRWQFLITVLLAVCAACLVVIAVAAASMAW
jgi:hypothetical protein